MPGNYKSTIISTLCMALSDGVSLLCTFSSVSSIQGFTSSVAATGHVDAKFLYSQGNPADCAVTELGCTGIEGHSQFLLVPNFASNPLEKSPTDITQSNTIK